MPAIPFYRQRWYNYKKVGVNHHHYGKRSHQARRQARAVQSGKNKALHPHGVQRRPHLGSPHKKHRFQSGKTDSEICREAKSDRNGGAEKESPRRIAKGGAESGKIVAAIRKAPARQTAVTVSGGRSFGFDEKCRKTFSAFFIQQKESQPHYHELDLPVIQ
jgi:hypothetical protein